MTGLILDLRNNGGGALTDAVGVAGLFLGEGPVVQVRPCAAAAKVLEATTRSIDYRARWSCWSTSSALRLQRLLPGPFRTIGRAVIVGSEHTHGKGTVQVIMDLDEA